MHVYHHGLFMGRYCKREVRFGTHEVRTEKKPRLKDLEGGHPDRLDSLRIPSSSPQPILNVP
jgi:hypothetical protein